MKKNICSQLILLIILAILLLFLGWRPYDRLTWWLEIFPIVIGLPILIATFRCFPLTSMVYYLIFFHAVILMIGGHYTYARVPLGFWAQDFFHFSRNHYDRLGHFAQGFVPAIIVREILLRKTPLSQGKMLSFLAVSVCLAISATYELIEWGSAIVLGESASDFLGTQGDVWDTQRDMLMAFIGAMTAIVLLSKPHDRFLTKIRG